MTIRLTSPPARPIVGRVISDRQPATDPAEANAAGPGEGAQAITRYSNPD
jgi:hypothetical protein